MAQRRQFYGDGGRVEAAVWERVFGAVITAFSYPASIYGVIGPSEDAQEWVSYASQHLGGHLGIELRPKD